MNPEALTTLRVLVDQGRHVAQQLRTSNRDEAAGKATHELCNVLTIAVTVIDHGLGNELSFEALIDRLINSLIHASIALGRCRASGRSLTPH